MIPNQRQKYSRVKYEHLLSSVLKPSRYINNEIHAFHKKPGSDLVNFCLVYPDVYEVGFSHLGLKILYTILNETTDAMADRAYCPWTDFGDMLKKYRLPLFSLENKVPLVDFDVIGFTLQSELTYTNILYILELSGIKLQADQREENEPIILAGGPNATNPKPLSQFIDAFLIGDGEEAIIEIKDVIKQAKGKNRDTTITELANLKGVYVPRSAQKNSSIKIRKIRDLNTQTYHRNQLIPWQMPTHYRYVSEIMRGCSRGCRFCHAGYFYRPVRELNPDILLSRLEKDMRLSGWQEAALSSLSSSDYTCIKPVMLALFTEFKRSRTSLSLPSLRLDNLDDQIIQIMNELRQTGLTIAPEAGSQRLRNIINKNINEEDILNTVQTAADKGWNLIKLYFMIGLPFETDEDITAIISLIFKIMSIKKGRMKLNITISPFVPKNHTPFQWAVMCSEQVLSSRINRIKKSFSKYGFIKIKYHEIQASQLECILGRGDKKVGELILKAYELGAIYDGWMEFFDFSCWQNAASMLNLDLNRYLAEIPLDQKLPWDDIDLGISREFLLQEWEKSRLEETTPDCRQGNCTDCGICTNDLYPVYSKEKLSKPLTSLNPQVITPDKSYPFRIFYSKGGNLRFVGHLDLVRTIQTILRASGLPLVYSRGFNIHPKLQFGPPLAIGIAGENEYLDLYLSEKLPVSHINSAINKNLPSEITIKKVNSLPDFKKQRHVYQNELLWVNLPPEFHEREMKEVITKFRNSPQCLIKRIKKGNEKEVDLKMIINSIELTSGLLIIKKTITGASIFDILLELFEIKRENTAELNITRKNFC